MSFFSELKRRNVKRVATAYLIVSWLVTQVANTLEETLNLPAWFDTLIVIVLLVGFPITLIVSWIYDFTPDGIKKDQGDKSNESNAKASSKKLNLIILVAAIGVVAMITWQIFNGKFAKSLIFDNQEVVKENVINDANDTSNQVKISEKNNKSIAVLPFDNVTNNPESEPITLGLHDDLLTHISKISALKVISRTSVLRYKNTLKSIAEIATELGVANILEGGVQRSGNQIRINVQLINAETDENIWAERFDSELTADNIFNVQTEISKKIAEALKAQLSDQEHNSLALQDTQNMQAYNAYLAGRQLLINRNSEELKQALKLFQKATELDANYALAYIAQADTLSLLMAYSDLSEENMFRLGEPLIEKALKLNPLMAEAYTSKASYLNDKGEFEKAEENFLYSIKLNPNYSTTYHWYGLMLRENLNRPEEALALHRKAALLDPLSPVIQLSVAASLQQLGLHKQALLELHKVMEYAPDYQGAPGEIADIYSIKGDYTKSVYWNKKAIELDSGNINLYASLLKAYLNIGDIAAAKTVLNNMQNKFFDNLELKMLQSLIYFAESNIKKWSQTIKELYDSQSSDYDVSTYYAFSLLINEDYEKANALFEDILSEVKNELSTVGVHYLEDIMAHTFTLKQLGETQKSQALISQVEELLNTIPEENVEWTPLFIKAIQGNTDETVNAFVKLIEEGKSQYWWFYLSLPYFKEMKNEPEFIKAYQRLMDILKQQRQELLELEQEGKTE